MLVIVFVHACVRAHVGARKMRGSLAVKYRTLPEIVRGAYDRERFRKDSHARTSNMRAFVERIIHEYTSERRATKTRKCLRRAALLQRERERDERVARSKGKERRPLSMLYTVSNYRYKGLIVDTV